MTRLTSIRGDLRNPPILLPGALVTILKADARRWADHTDAWRFGSDSCALTTPPTLTNYGFPWLTGAQRLDLILTARGDQ